MRFALALGLIAAGGLLVYELIGVIEVLALALIIALILDPAVNLRIGLTHLSVEVAHFGDRSLGLLSYNMGRSRVSRALES